MFEAAVPWDVASQGPEPVAPVDLDAFEDVPLTDAELDVLAAGDPERSRTLAEILAEAERGAISAALAAQLVAIDVTTLGDDERIAVAVAAQRCVNHYEGVKLRAVGAFAGAEPRDDTGAGAFAWTEVAGALRLGEGQARQLTHHGRRLRTHLHRTLAGMLAGDVSLAKAQTLIHTTELLDEEQCAQVEDLVLPHAAGRNPGNHSAAVARAVRKVDPDGWKHRREQQLRDIAMIRLSQGDGVADMLLRGLDSMQSELLWTGADTWARTQKAAGDTRTLDALRVAAVLDWCTRYLTGIPITPDTGDAQPSPTPQPPTRHGAPAVVNVMINLPDLIDPARGGAATVAGNGAPLPAEAVAEPLRDGARIRVPLPDHNGRLTGISPKLHDPTTLTRAFIALRDVTLRVPGGST